MKKALVFLIMIAILSCENSPNEKLETLKPNKQDESSKVTQIKAILIGRKLNSLSNLISLNKKSEPILIFYFTGNDCYSCIEKGFRYLSKLSSLNKNIDFYVIDANLGLDLGSDELNFHSDSYPDSTKSLKKELLYVDTPIFIKYRIDNGIVSFYTIPIKEDELDIENYFKTL